MPLQFPIKATDGKTSITEISLKKNTHVIININGANRSKAIWGEDAEEWKPERWLNPLPQSVTEAHLPGVYSSMSVSDPFNVCSYTADINIVFSISFPG